MMSEQPAKSGADALSRRARDMARNIQGNLGRCLYRRKDVAEMEEVSETLMELADELNAELGSEPPYDELLRCLENDWNIRASWDGLRKFWSIELTEEGVRLRDAKLGSGTCIVTHDFNCSNCGKQIGVVRNCEMYETCDGQQAWKSLDHEVCDIPNYCPNCGAKVVG